MAKEHRKQEQAPEQGAGESSPPEQTPDGVLVTVSVDERGEYAINVQTVGNTSVMEAPTILDLASKRVRAQLGI